MCTYNKVIKSICFLGLGYKYYLRLYNCGQATSNYINKYKTASYVID